MLMSKQADSSAVMSIKSSDETEKGDSSNYSADLVELSRMENKILHELVKVDNRQAVKSAVISRVSSDVTSDESSDATSNESSDESKKRLSSKDSDLVDLSLMEAELLLELAQDKVNYVRQNSIKE